MFSITSGLKMMGANESGPRSDADGKEHGKSLIKIFFNCGLDKS